MNPLSNGRPCLHPTDPQLAPSPLAGLPALLETIASVLRKAGVSFKVQLAMGAPAAEEVSPSTNGPGDSSPCTAPVGEIADLVRGLLAKAERPLKLVGIARRLNRDLTSHFRKVVYKLRAAGELRALPGRYYWLASRPLPAGDA